MQPAKFSRRRFIAQTAGRTGALAVFGALVPAFGGAPASDPKAARHPVPKAHPRLLGSRAELQQLAKQKATEYQRVMRVARDASADDWSRMVALGLVAAIEQDHALARAAQQIAMKYVGGPIRKGHVPFATDLAICAMAYDLCHEAWTAEDRQRFHIYVNQTVDANVQSETHVFHNAWYGYKHWGIGLAGYAAYYENPRAQAILKALEEEYRLRAAPALELAGDGGGWGEGYYIHYWLYEWLFFCEVARRCEGVDYYAMAPKFFAPRAVAAMFEMYPGIGEYGSRRPVPMGDGGGRQFGGDRDKTLCARRILANYYRQDPAHQAVHAFNETTPRVSVGNYAYKDFLWRDSSLPKGDLARFKLSHVSPGPGFVYARSSWEEDATYFFFKCGKRFTAHQHLDVNHFVIFKHTELAGDGGHYDDFGSGHDVNYHLRTIAHNTILVHDPAERWPGIRAGQVTGNDGGQHHGWPHHNGAVGDAAEWQKQRPLYDIADLLAYEDTGDYLYVAGDASRAYAKQKLAYFTRQIIFLRPGTFVIFDRVKSTQPEFKKTWLLQALRPPVKQAPGLVITNGKGRLFVQTLLPAEHKVELAAGEDLYRYGGNVYPPRRNTGAAPECRIQISPAKSAATDYFLHVLTATSADVETAPRASVNTGPSQVIVEVGGITAVFNTERPGGTVEIRGQRVKLAEQVRLT
jgi:hypothetical protein